MEIIENLFGNNLYTALFVIFNLIVLESLLSVDNAAVLASMVMHLEGKDRRKALSYGIFGAYFFRGLCLIFASILYKIAWLKGLGGLYLLWLSINHFRKFNNKEKKEENKKVEKNNFFNFIEKNIGSFWTTVIAIETMDLAFSLDNIFAAVAFTDKIGLICLGVFIGILAMRFAAQIFINLMEKFHFLENLAFIVIGILGLKLISSYFCGFITTATFCKIMETHGADMMVSLTTILIFVVPILTSIFFNYPKKKV